MEQTRIKRINMMKTDAEYYNIPCYMPESVKVEVYDKVMEVCDFLGNKIVGVIKTALEDSRRRRNVSLNASITSKDIRVLEDVISEHHKIKVKSDPRRFLLPTPLTVIEEWIIEMISDKMRKRETVSLTEFESEIIKEIIKTVSTFEEVYQLLELEEGYIKISKDQPDPSVKEKLEKLANVHDPDSKHIASAISHQEAKKEKTIYVTLDYKTILSNREKIWKMFRLECCDPLYAIYHLI